MRLAKKIRVVVFSIIILLALFAIWYTYKFSMTEVEGYEVNSAGYHDKLLIATQGSDFKDAITKNVVDYYKRDSVFINVIDISSLAQIEPQDYTALLLMHTWENWKPPPEIKAFIDRTTNYENRIIVLTTSGKGSYRMDNVDALVGESKLQNVDSFTRKIIRRLDPLIK